VEGEARGAVQQAVALSHPGFDGDLDARMICPGKPWRTTTPDPGAQRRPDLVERDFSALSPRAGRLARALGVGRRRGRGPNLRARQQPLRDGVAGGGRPTGRPRGDLWRGMCEDWRCRFPPRARVFIVV
jgi:hypothetical protein